jgi:hypothetical protein
LVLLALTPEDDGMNQASWVVLLAATIVVATGCTHKDQTPTSNESGGAAATATNAAPSEMAATNTPTANGKLYVSFQFTDAAVTSSASPVLRLGFNIKNSGADPLLCEESMFSLQLADGSTLAPDSGAENRCDPDTIDPGSTGKSTMFFDLKSGYSGPVTLIMSDNSTVIGRGTTQLH